MCGKNPQNSSHAAELHRRGLSRLTIYFASLYDETTVVLMMETTGPPTLLTSGDPYILGGFELCGRRCSVTSSRSEDHLKFHVVSGSTLYPE